MLRADAATHVDEITEKLEAELSSSEIGWPKAKQLPGKM